MATRLRRYVARATLVMVFNVMVIFLMVMDEFGVSFDVLVLVVMEVSMEILGVFAAATAVWYCVMSMAFLLI